ncbi:alpha/beta fold hydrolase [Lentzea flaviverrucosa]|uniref:Pimeloyl-ACP methyl ester carboxylesterase n=1 Tax=Lentzea flaviverrucosa TaxID=200379 RepID=A0A1H9B6R4_9PSEU|nr:alpha/beta hydrolase [Lentzea flaviverrucosa]RDI31883.1 pimeloyl-ACP methyl ester carboxylesterase [Lentzea flaviverrucosa]SEP83938.1 Pimeloyl-ACP methyl ester carboxylesterase [Lentzea flaviverrucosa]
MVRLEDGTELNVLRAGDPDSPVTVVLAHGYALDHRTWHKVVEQLSPEFQVIAYDHRGHGGSGGASKETATIDQLGEDLGELIERAVPQGHVVIAGHSMGGMAALAMAERRPRLFRQRVLGNVFVSTAASGMSETSLAWPKAVGKLVRELERAFGPIVRAVREKIEPAKTAGLRWWLFGDEPSDEDVELTADVVWGHWPETIALFRPTVDRYDREAGLMVAKEKAVVAVVGDEDRLVPESDAVKFGGTSVILSDAGHMLPLERPAELANLIREVAAKA